MREYMGARFKRLADALFSGKLADDAFIAARATELDNLRAAMAWSLSEPGDVDIALELLGQTAPLCNLMPAFNECQRWLLGLSRQVRDQPLSMRQAAWLRYIEITWGVQGIFLNAGSGAIGREPQLAALGDERRQAYASIALLVVATWRGDLEAARAALDECSRLNPSSWPAWLSALCLEGTIRMRHLRGDTSSAVAELEAVLERLTAEGNGAGRGAFVVRTNLALESLIAGQREVAVRQLQELAEQGRSQRRDVHRMCFALVPLATVLTDLGRLSEARDIVIEVLPKLQHTGFRSICAPTLALLALKRGRPDTAMRLLAAGDAWLARTGTRRTLIESRVAQQVRQAIAATHTAERIDAWVGEGERLNEEEFGRLVTEES